MTAAPPYPADTKAKGWRFELDYEQIEQSSTWALAGPEGRPWLLMLWMTAWRQVPSGSMPNDEEVIAALIGMPPKLWAKHRKAMLRGWSLAADGLLYHPTVSARVLEMLEYRRKNAERVAKFKAAKREQHAGNALPTGEQHDSNDTGTGTGTGTNIGSVPIGTDAAASTPPPAAPPPPPAKLLSPEEQAKADVWRSAVDVLQAGGCKAEATCRTFMGKLVADYGFPAVKDAVAAAATAQPADAREYLKATCQRLAGERKTPNRQEAIETRNRAVGQAWLEKQGEHHATA